MEIMYDFLPWLYWSRATDEERSAQALWQGTLRERGVREVGERTYLSPLAAIHETTLRIGRDSYVAAHVYLTDDVEIGDNSTLNPFAVVRGQVRLGDGVRVGSHASLLGFNHSMAPDRPVYEQPITTEGITVGDDVWIGSHVVVVDGVTIGEHSVIGAGAVVTKDVPPWSIMAGNPARRIRDRRDKAGTPAGTRADDLSARLARFADRAREEAPALLDRYWQPEHGQFVNQPGGALDVRATCDAVEISDLLLGAPPPQMPASSLVDWLKQQSREDYHILCVGYALDLLGAPFQDPIALDHDGLVSRLDSLPWRTAAWTAGAWVDAFGTALLWNRRLGAPAPLETLFGWLLTRQDRWTGLWGSPTAGERFRQPVNGYYRLTRGTFAQFGLPVPRPETTIDAVLAHSRDAGFFGDGRGTACDVLDVIHPLWLCGQQTRHRRDDARAWARERLDAALSRWRPGAGFAFSPAPTAGSEHECGLMGTEMWLAIVWLLADVLGESGALGYRPRGVHRPEPAI
jgi:acetyltransferase-like isoleucine patch superfamily enzyme